MVNTGMQLISFTCAVTGWIMAIAVTALPQWKVSAFIGSNILTSEIKGRDLDELHLPDHGSHAV